MKDRSQNPQEGHSLARGANGRGAPVSDSLKLPPQNLEAERAVLGAMLVSPQMIEPVAAIIGRQDADWFYRPDHRLIFGLILDLYEAKKPVDLIAFEAEAARQGKSEVIGGRDYVVYLAESIPDWCNAEYYAKLVRDKGLLRDLIRASGQMEAAAYDAVDPAETIIDAASAAVLGLASRRIGGAAVEVGQECGRVFGLLEADGATEALPTGFHELDDLLGGGLEPGVIIVAGRPSMGKTAWGMNVAERLAVDGGIPIGVISLEMTAPQLAQRLLCGRAQVDGNKFRRRMLSTQDQADLERAVAEIRDAPLLVDTSPETVMAVRASARRLIQTRGIRLLVVDYLQLLTSPSTRREKRHEEVADVSRGLKRLAAELNIPVLLLCQLNRQAEGREGHRPRMSDLRESGAIEQDADVILLLHRDEYYNPDDPAAKGIAEVIIAKQRNGPTGIVKLHFNSRLTRFENLAVNAGPETDYHPPMRYVPEQGVDTPW